MGDGDAERDRRPARRAESGGGSGRNGDIGGAEDFRANAGGRSPREVAGTSASSPAGSRESGADSDGQPGPGEADHCRRILVRGKGTAGGSGQWAPMWPLLGPPTFLQPLPLNSYIRSFIIPPFVQKILF
jgi:hypothetical protein